MGSNFDLNFYFSVFKLFQMNRKLFSNFTFVKLSEICFFTEVAMFRENSKKMLKWFIAQP